MSEDDDGGMQWNAETQREREEHFGERDARLLREHAEWIRKFKLGLTTTNVKNADNETNNERTI